MWGIRFRLPWYLAANAETAVQPEVDRQEEIARIKYRVDRWFGFCLLFGVFATLIFGLAVGTPGNAKGFFPNLTLSLGGALIALGIAGAAMAIGTITGFLFGLPRSLTSSEFREIAGLRAQSADQGDGAGPAPAGRDASPAPAGSYGPNTNLERISDWLTTIIVGVGLTQLGAIIPQLDALGDRMEPLFATGGHSFGIAAALYFTIFGFLMSYISTRTKLTLVFTENAADTIWLQRHREAMAIERAASTSPVKPVVRTSKAVAGAKPAISPDDQLVLARQFSDKQTPGQILATANASARAGDYRKALALYRDYTKTAPFDGKIWVDYAGVLGLNGDEKTFAEVKQALAQRGSNAIADDGEKSFQKGLKSALQASLYESDYDEAIRVGEMLVARAAKDDAWTHLWLAAAYGQRHAVLSVDPHRQPEAGIAADRAVAEVTRTLQLNPALRNLLINLYDPARVVNEDNDLVSLFESQRLHKILGL